MARPKGSTKQPSYRLHKPSGRAVVTIDGKDWPLGKYGTRQTSPESWQKYDRLMAEWYARGRQGPTAGNPATATVSQIAAAFLDYAERVDPRVMRSESVVATRWLCRYYGDTPASEFSPLKMKSIREVMVKTKKLTHGREVHKHTLSRGYVNGIVTSMVQMFRWAVENEMVPPHVYQSLKAVRPLGRGMSGVRETAPVRPVEQEHIDAVLRVAPRNVAAMIRFQLLTGARPGETTILRGCDIDMSGPVWRYTPQKHKTEHHGHSRVIFIGPKAQEVIRPFLKPNTTAYLFSPAECKPPRRGRVRRPKGVKARQWHAHYNTNNYNGSVGKICDALDQEEHRRRPDVPADVRLFPHWHVHQLRHSAATYLRAEFGIDVARAVLGHRSAAITEIYAEQDMSKAAQAMARVG